MQNNSYMRYRQAIFFFLPLFCTFLITYIISTNIKYNEIWFWLDIIWLIILTILNYNLFLVSLAAFFSFLPDKNKNNKLAILGENTKAVLVYSVKNEYAFKEKLLHSVLNNKEVLSEVVIISNSTETKAVELEKLILEIVNSYGVKGTFFAGKPPKHIGLYNWCQSRADIEFFLTSDADSYYPKNSIKELLKRGKDQRNSEVAIFQSNIFALKNNTIFNHFLSIGQKLAGRLYAVGFAKAIGQSGYYGSGALIRMSDFLIMQKLIEENKYLPVTDILSHDVWEAAVLVNLGKKIQYIPEVITFEEFPSSYIDMIKRGNRWLKGTFQSRKMLRMFKTNDIAAIFLISFPIVMYLIQPVFLFWLVLGATRILFSETVNYEIHFQVTLTLLGLLFIQKFFAIRKFSEIGEVIVEIIASSLFYINSPIFITIALFDILKKATWTPMPKIFKAYTIWACLKFFKFNMLIGITALTLAFWYSRSKAFWVVPFFGSLSISGILDFLSQKPMKNELGYITKTK